jgi:tetratricopeptide (TPR) repeat protein
MTLAELREAGNNLFRAQRYAAAAESYSAALEAVGNQQQQQLEQEPEQHSDVMIRAVLLNNRAIANLRGGRVEAAIADATRALELLDDGDMTTAVASTTTTIKALMRRAEAHVQLHEHDAAVRDYSAALRVQKREAELRQLTPIEQPGWVALALVRRALAWESLGRIDALELALQDLRSAHEVWPCGRLAWQAAAAADDILLHRLLLLTAGC